jgi:hypothetical protein
LPIIPAPSLQPIAAAHVRHRHREESNRHQDKNDVLHFFSLPKNSKNPR